MNSVVRRLLGIKMKLALLLMLPGFLICIWFITSAFMSFYRYNLAVGGDNKLTLELFHILLHDEIEKNVNWLAARRQAGEGRIDVMDFSLHSSELPVFYSGAGKQDERPWATAQMATDEGLFDVRVRMRGSRHWNYLSRKKSFRVKIDSDQNYQGMEDFNLNSHSTQFLLGEKIISDLARQRGVLVPENKLVRVLINGDDLGVYNFSGLADNSIFRRGQLMYGAIFAGDSNSKDQLSMWRNHEKWNVVTTLTEDGKRETRQFERLLSVLTRGTHAEFFDYSRKHIDQEAFANFEAVGVAFGIKQHGFDENQKILQDPYRGRWLPVAWDMRGFAHEEVFNRAENPISLRLKMLPEYRLLRDRLLYEFLKNEANVSNVRQRIIKELRHSANDLKKDRLYSAYKQLPNVNDFMYRMLRPMNLTRTFVVAQTELMKFRQRHHYLLEHLEQNFLFVRNHPSKDNLLADDDSEVSEEEVKEDEELQEAAKPRFETEIEVIVARGAGVELRKIEFEFLKDCKEVNWILKNEEGHILQEGNRHFVNLPKNTVLYSGADLVDRSENASDLSMLTIRYLPVSYKYNLLSSCLPEKITPIGRNAVTDKRLTAIPLDAEIAELLTSDFAGVDDVPVFAGGTKLPHPADFVVPQIEDVVLGPGVINVSSSLWFDEFKNVKVMPGTVFKMAPRVSLFFSGKVEMHGSKEDPIVIEPEGKEAFGGIVISGPAASGSSMAFVHIHDGSRASDGVRYLPAMINIHDMKKFTIEDSFFARNVRGDLLHTAYINNLRIERLEVQDASEDALDLEFTNAKIRGLKVLGAEDECIDLMGSTIYLNDSILDRCRGKAISAGQRSDVYAEDTLMSNSDVGILAKGASRLFLDSVLLFQNRIGLRLRDESNRYEGKIFVTGSDLHIVGSKQRDIWRRGRSTIDDGYVYNGFSSWKGLQRLFFDVLKIDGPEKLESRFPAEKVAR